MAKRKKEIRDPDTGEIFDSTHELWFYWYLQELKYRGYIVGFKRSKEYTLTDKVVATFTDFRKSIKGKKNNKVLLQSSTYTPDFTFQWNTAARNIFYQEWSTFNDVNPDVRYNNLPFSVVYTDLIMYPISVIDVKNPFNKADVHTRFALKQKAMFDKHGIYVQKLDIQTLFAQTFRPKRFLLTDSGKSDRKINFITRSFEEYIKLRNKINGT